MMYKKMNNYTILTRISYLYQSHSDMSRIAALDV